MTGARVPVLAKAAARRGARVARPQLLWAVSWRDVTGKAAGEISLLADSSSKFFTSLVLCFHFSSAVLFFFFFSTGKPVQIRAGALHMHLGFAGFSNLRAWEL